MATLEVTDLPVPAKDTRFPSTNQALNCWCVKQGMMQCLPAVWPLNGVGHVCVRVHMHVRRARRRTDPMAAPVAFSRWTVMRSNGQEDGARFYLLGRRPFVVAGQSGGISCLWSRSVQGGRQAGMRTTTNPRTAPHRGYCITSKHAIRRRTAP